MASLRIFGSRSVRRIIPSQAGLIQHRPSGVRHAQSDAQAKIDRAASGVRHEQSPAAHTKIDSTGVPPTSLPVSYSV